MGQYLEPLLDIYWDIQKEHIPEFQKYEMISDLMLWHLGAVLARYLELYWSSEMDIYLDIILECVSKVKMSY